MSAELAKTKSLLEKETEDLAKERSQALLEGGDDTEIPARHCTDVCFLLFFIAFFTGMGYILYYSLANGNIDKVTHGFDWEGRICGVDEEFGGSSDIVDKPYLYWCAMDATTLSDPICVSKCPVGPSTSSRCPKTATSKAENKEDEDGKLIERKITITREMVDQKDIETEPVLGMYCLPSENEALLKKILTLPGVSSYSKQIFTALNSVTQKWTFLIGVLFLATIVGYAFLFLLKYIVKPFIYLLFAAVFLLLNLFGLWCTALGLKPGDFSAIGITLSDSYFKVTQATVEYNPLTSYLPQDQAQRAQLWIGIVLLILSFLFLCFWCCACKGIRLTCKAISNSCDTLWRMPTLLLQPLVQVVTHILAFVVMFYGFLWVVSLGHVTTTNPMEDPEMGLPVDVTGVYRSFTFTRYQWYALFYWAFGSIWVYELMTAMGQYALSHAVVVSTVMKDPPRCLPLSRGYLNGLTFHLGTLAFASFIIGLLRFITMILAWIGKQTRSADGTKNKAVQVVFACCTCCLACLEQIMRLVNEMVYVDVALSGRNYLSAAYNVFKMTVENPATAVTVIGSVRAIKYLGILVIGGVGTYLSYLVLANPESVSTFFRMAASSTDTVTSHFSLPPVNNYADLAAQSLHTSDVLGMTVASGLVCFAIGTTFMSIFVIAAQALAYVMVSKGEVDED